MPFLTMHFVDHHLSFTEIGRIHAANAIFHATMPLLWGVLADRYVAVNRLLMFVHGAGVAALVFLSTQETFWGLLVGSTLWFASGAATFTIYNAYSYHNLKSPEEEFGSLRMWGSVGWMLPSLPILLWLRDSEAGSLQFVFLMAAAIEAGFVLLAAVLLPHTPPSVLVGSEHDDHGNRGQDTLSFSAALAVLLRHPGFWVLLATAVLMSWSFSVFFYYSPLLLEQNGVDRKWYGLIQCVGVVIEIPFFWTLRHVLNRLGSTGTLALGCGLMAARQTLCTVTDVPWMLIGSYVFVGLAVVFYLIPSSLAVEALAGKQVRATAQALLLLAGPGLGTLAGQLFSGWLIDHTRHGFRGVFLVAAVVSVAALLLLPLVGHLQRRQERAAGGDRDQPR